MHNVHITLQELQAVTIMLCRMAFCLSSKAVALHLDNNIYYLSDQGGTVSLSRLACHILNLAIKHEIILIQSYITTHLNVEATFLL